MSYASGALDESQQRIGSGSSASGYPSLGEWLRKPDQPVALLEQRGDRDRLGEIFHTRQATSFGDPATPDFILCLVTHGRAPEDISFDLGFGRFDVAGRKGEIVAFTPEASSQIAGPGGYELLNLALPWSLIRPRLEATCDREMAHLPPTVHSRGFRDPLIERVVYRLWDEMHPTRGNAQSPGGTLLADGLVNVLLGRLLQLGDEPIPGPGKRAKLHPRKYAAVLAYIDAHLDESLTLDGLATVARCSRFHFARLFKASAGEPPLTYVTRQRVERAQRLMFDHPEWTLAAVALACGFADQSHLNRHFKRIVGVTPGQYRGEAGR
ncbi:MAG: AraC family transcriptional regulator [Chloroflexota bacterium]